MDHLDLLRAFIAAACTEAPGQTMPYGLFVERLHQWLPPDRRAEFGRVRVGQYLDQLGVIRGRRSAGSPVVIGNLTLRGQQHKFVRSAPGRIALATVGA